MSPASAFLDEVTIRKLNQLTLVARQVRAGVIKGERRSTRRGMSIEFADYRNYVPGDDLRRLDWNVYARLDRPFLKIFEEEEDLAVHLLVDVSRSMDWGEGDTNKRMYAFRLAAALGSIALGAGDRLSIALLNNGRVQSQLGPLRGAPRLVQLLSFLDTQAQENVSQTKSSTSLDTAIRQYSLVGARPGLTFLISDLYPETQAGHRHEVVGDYLSPLLGRGYEMAVLHLLSPDEWDPPLAGDLRLVDLESRAVQELSLDASMRSLYQRRMKDWIASWQKECRKLSISYLALNTATPWEKVVLSEMRRLGMVR